MKELLFSVTAKDFEFETFRAGGKGGQAQNKKNTGVRITHRASGAVGVARDSRSQPQNRKAAFMRLLETPEWKAWHRAETLRRLGAAAAAEQAVDTAMSPENLLVEVRTDKGWEKAE